MEDTFTKMSDRDLLITMVTEQKHIKEQLKDLKEAVSSKVGITEFQKLEGEVTEIKKVQDGINIKMAWYAGAIAVVTAIFSFLANKFI